MAVEIFDPNADRDPDGMFKHAGTMSETSNLTPDQIREKFKGDQNWPLQSFDAQDWAEAFMAKFGDKRDQIDKGLMLAWFASALMRGWDEREWHGAGRSLQPACRHPHCACRAGKCERLY